MATDIIKMLDHITNNDYSASEIKTGKTWIDGKPIYRKCFNRTVSNGEVLVSNVDMLVSSYGVVDMGYIWRALPFYETSVSGVNEVAPRLSWEGEIYLQMLVNSTPYSGTVRLTVEYTKTTD